jgi:DNA-binding transcriptional LysR family regulator
VSVDQWRELELFVAIAERGSLSKAAETLSISNGASSRHLAALEKRLGARLIDRNTRKMRLTEIGQQFYVRCKSALDDVREAERAVSASSSDPSGVLRVAGPLTFCMNELAPVVPEFSERYPNIVVQLMANNQYRDLFEEGIDVAFRTRRYEIDSNVTTRRLVSTGRSLAASPAYIKRFGEPKAPEDLVLHRILTYAYASQRELTLSRGKKKVDVKLRSVFEANDGQILRAVALKGYGISVQPNYIIHDDIVAGRLVRLLPDWHMPSLQINVSYPSRSHLPAKTRAFIDFVAKRFQGKDSQSKWLAKTDRSKKDQT